MAVERSTFRAIVPKDFEFRYLEKTETPKVKFTSYELADTYIWDTANVRAIADEYFSLESE